MKNFFFKKLNVIDLAPAIFLLISSCLGGPQTSMKAGKSSGIIEEFSRGVGKRLYFIKPLAFKSTDEKAEVDFTYNYERGGDANVTVTFSVYSPEPYINIDSACFSLESGLFCLDSLTKYFAEPHKNEYKSRYAGKITYKELQSIFNHKAHDFHIFLKQKHIIFTANRWDKYSSAVHEKIFIPVKLDR